MGSDATVRAYRENVEQIVAMVFQTMLEVETQPHLAPWNSYPDVVTAVVHFTGAWHGAVLLECTRQQACQFARLLMSIEIPEALNEDVRDALGELANMLAGNLKSVLPPGVYLSMPSVIEGSDYSLDICGKRAMERVPFWSDLGIFGVTLVETAGRFDSSRRRAPEPSAA